MKTITKIATLALCACLSMGALAGCGGGTVMTSCHPDPCVMLSVAKHPEERSPT